MKDMYQLTFKLIDCRAVSWILLKLLKNYDNGCAQKYLILYLLIYFIFKSLYLPIKCKSGTFLIEKKKKLYFHYIINMYLHLWCIIFSILLFDLSSIVEGEINLCAALTLFIRAVFMWNIPMNAII